MSDARCLVCLDALPDAATEYHSRCLKMLFETKTVPRLDIDLARLHTVGLAMVGRASLSGVQRKISLRASGDRETLSLEVGAGRFILKPQAATLPNLPENEHVTMRVAHAMGIEVPACGLVRLSDATLAYVTRRFDRVQVGERVRKLRQEDFCQLAEASPKEKYGGSTEGLFRILARYASEPPIEAVKLYRLALFCFLTGNGDAHLKNFALLAGDDGLHRLAPAYDLLNTRLVIRDDPLALPIDGKKAGLTRKSFLELARSARLPPKIAERELANLAAALPSATDLVERSFLPEPMRIEYRALLEDRAATLRG